MLPSSLALLAAVRSGPAAWHAAASLPPLLAAARLGRRLCSSPPAGSTAGPGAPPGGPSPTGAAAGSTAAAASTASGGGGAGMAAEDALHVSVEPLADELEGVSVVTLNRPRARNAFGRQLLAELQEAINNLRQEPTTRCVVVRSAVPGVFSAGADLKERSRMTQAEVAEVVSWTRRVLSELEALPMPVVAAIDGLALGGGAELALACDVRVAGEAAALGWPEAQLGIIPGAGGTQRLPRIVGLPLAKELIFTGRRVTAQEAHSIGLANHLAPARAAGDATPGYDRALELARDIARSAPLALRMAKAAMGLGMNVDMASGLRVEEACYAQLIPTKDRLEGLKAFAEKRKPVYRGE